MNYSATDIWERLLNNILTHGHECTPRGLETLEILGSHTLVNMQYPVVLTKPRGLNYKFMAAEAWWILSGRDDSESIGRYCKNITAFADQDDGQRFFGAYGPKIMEQFSYVIDKLVEDPTSRQAVINIWRENPPATRDVPCTISVQWMIRHGALHCIDTMRSSDAWLGWPYDVFNFSMLSWQLLEQLRLRGMPELQLGMLSLSAGSQHLYRKDIDRLTRWNSDTLTELQPLPAAAIAGEPIESANPSVSVISELASCIGENDSEPQTAFFRMFKQFLINKEQPQPK